MRDLYTQTNAIKLFEWINTLNTFLENIIHIKYLRILNLLISGQSVESVDNFYDRPGGLFRADHTGLQ